MEELSAHIRLLREDFSHGKLDESDLLPDPHQQYEKWLAQAVEAQLSEVQAMNLATISETGQPSSRIVYLREFNASGFCFYTNYQSDKAADIAFNPRVALNFFWKELERQVRIEGLVEKVSEAQSIAYFNGRPYDSKIGAWASAQSGVLMNRKELEDKISELKNSMSPETIVKPDFWGGYCVKATRFEFWQGRHSRLHDRFAYTLKNNSWNINRLSP
jgi:pyridoxamine 5'-phosphate oxidase